MRLPKPWLRKSENAYYLTLNGQQIKLGKTKAEADEAYRRILFERGLHSVSRSKVTLHELIDQYWEWCKTHSAQTTVDRRRPLVESLRRFVAAAMLAEDLNPIIVDRWLATFKIGSPTTTATRQTMVCSIMNWGVKMGLLSRNPLANMPRAQARVRQDFLTPEQLLAVLQAAPNQEAHDLLTFLADTGARPQEAFKVHARHLQDGKLVWPIVDSKGRRVSRVIYLPPRTLELVTRLAAEWPRGPIFRTPKGHPWSRSSIGKVLSKIRRDLKLPALCATMFRHSFAHHRLANGQDAVLVAKLLGHASTEMLYGTGTSTRATSWPRLPLPWLRSVKLPRPGHAGLHQLATDANHTVDPHLHVLPAVEGGRGQPEFFGCLGHRH